MKQIWRVWKILYDYVYIIILHVYIIILQVYEICVAMSVRGHRIKLQRNTMIWS